VTAARPGRDRRAVRHPAPGGELDAGRLARRPHVVVAGGGIAGLDRASEYDAGLFAWQSESTAVTESEANYRTGGANNKTG